MTKATGRPPRRCSLAPADSHCDIPTETGSMPYVPPMIADQWYARVTFVDGDALLFDLVSHKAMAEELS